MLLFGNTFLLVSCYDFQGVIDTSQGRAEECGNGWKKNIHLARAKKAGEGRWGNSADLQLMFEL